MGKYDCAFLDGLLWAVLFNMVIIINDLQLAIFMSSFCPGHQLTIGITNVPLVISESALRM